MNFYILAFFFLDVLIIFQADTNLFDAFEVLLHHSPYTSHIFLYFLIQEMTQILLENRSTNLSNKTVVVYTVFVIFLILPIKSLRRRQLECIRVTVVRRHGGRSLR